MSKYEVLNKEKHQQLRIRTGYGAALGDAIMYVISYPMEFRDIQSSYPILFTKDPTTGGFFAAAFLGFEVDQNLFLRNGGWDAAYVPAMLRRQPFLIGVGNSDNETPVVSLDIDHPRVSHDEGDALFDATGAPTEFLRRKIELLERVHRGLQHSKGFIDTLLAHQLLEQITVDITFDDSSIKSLQGFYGIAEERLYELKGPVLESLNQAGYLQAIFMVIASMSRMRDLIERRNRLKA